MSKLQPMYFAASVALALASASVDAQTTTAPAAAPGAMVAQPRAARSGPVTSPTNSVPAAATSNTSTNTGGTTTGGTTGTGTTNTTTGDTTTTTTTTTTGTTSGSSQDGTSSGSALTESQRRNLAASRDTRGTTRATNSLSPNAVNGGLSPNAVNGGLSPNATTSSTTTTTGGGTATTTTTTNNANPLLNRGGVAGGLVVLDNGTALPANANGISFNGERVGSQMFAESSGSSTDIGFDNSTANGGGTITMAGSTVQLSSGLTEIEKRELRKRQNVGRNQQLLNTIAPRTNVDRTWQMPDDAPTPALKTSR